MVIYKYKKTAYNRQPFYILITRINSEINQVVFTCRKAWHS